MKGPGGGYELACPPEAIRAGDVVRAVEGPIELVRCVVPGSGLPCKRTGDCVTRLLWERLSDAVEEILDSVTLQDLCEEARELDERGLRVG